MNWAPRSHANKTPYQITFWRHESPPPVTSAVKPGEGRVSGQWIQVQLLDLDFRQPDAVAVAGLRCGQLGKGLDGDNHILGLHRCGKRHGQLR